MTKKVLDLKNTTPIQVDSLIANSSTNEKEELTIEKLFEDYNGESFKSDVFSFEPIGKENW